MFRHEGVGRAHRLDCMLAGYLALVAGFVNSAGFILLGAFTSHVTGNVGRFADNLALGDSAALFAALLVVAYFAGAFLASVAIESNLLRRRSTVYSGLLLSEAALVVAFMSLSYVMDSRSPRLHDIQALLLCMAMGLQNSLVTRLSGAVVRTTHLTGVVTDLGIETARWFRVWRATVGKATGRRLLVGAQHALAPQLPRTILLLTMFVAFVAGSVIGAFTAVAWGLAAMTGPVACLTAGGLIGLWSGRELPLNDRSLGRAVPVPASDAARR